MSRRQTTLLWYAAVGVTVNVFMQAGRIWGWWS